MNDQNIKRVLHIVSALERGGAETLIMNIYRNINRNRVQFDFITHSNQKGDYEEEILELGGRIFRIPSLGQIGPFFYLKKLIKIMKSYPFSAVHSHTDYQSGFPALAAKLCGIDKRICHSHSSNWQKENNFKGRILLKILRFIIKISTTDCSSCSEEAGQFLFGHEKVTILRNGIDLHQFERSKANDRKSVFEELTLPENTKVIGHVGRFSDSKNHLFLLKVLKSLIEKDKSFTALLVGDGPLKKQIENEATKQGLLNHIKFLGVRDDISRLMNAFDVFLFPSKFEGFGIVTLEAQCSGIPCVISNTVPKTIDMGLGLITFMSLDESIERWCMNVIDAIKLSKPDKRAIKEKISKQGYSIQNNIDDWMRLYGMSG